MTKRTACPTFEQFEQMFGEPAADELLTRIVEAHYDHGKSGGNGIRYSNVVKHNTLNYTYTGSVSYAGQDIAFTVRSGDMAGKEVDEFDFDSGAVLNNREQLLWDARRSRVLADLLQGVLLHLKPVLADSNLELTPICNRNRLNLVLESQPSAVCVPASIRDPGLTSSYPGVAQCELEFSGEYCVLNLQATALHLDNDDSMELLLRASPFATTRLATEKVKLDSRGLFNVELAAKRLLDVWTAQVLKGTFDKYSPLARQELQFAGKLLEACKP